MDKSEPHIIYCANNASYRITKNINDKQVYLNIDLQWDAYKDPTNRIAHIDQAINRWRALCGSVTNRTIYIQYNWQVVNGGTNVWFVMNDTHANTHYLRKDGSVETTCGFEGYYDTAQEAVKNIQHYIKNNKKQKRTDSPSQPQPTMNIKTVYITTPTLFKGEDISVMSSDRIMDNIRQLNIEKKNLVSLDVDSKAVQEGIANINKAIAVLVKQLDA